MQRGLKGKRSILGYHWADAAKGWDLMVVRGDGVKLFNVNSKDLKAKTVKEIDRNIGHYWYEGSSGVLVLAESPPHLGILRVYTLFEDRNRKGTKVNIDVSPCVTDVWTNSAFEGRDLCVQGDDPAPHAIALKRMYTDVYLVHIHCVTGSVSLYKIDRENGCSYGEQLRVSPGNYCVSVIDDVAVFQNFTEQSSYLFDVKSRRKAEPICVIWHGIPTAGGSVTFRVYIDRSTTDFFPEIQLKYDGKVIPRLSDFTGAVDVAKRVNLVECEWPLRLDFPQVTDDVFISPGTCTCLRLSLNIPEIVSNWFKSEECIPFQLRRPSSKATALDYSLALLERQRSIGTVLSLLTVLVSNHDGEGLTQNDLHNLLFRRVYLSTVLDPEYISAVLLAFFHASLSTGLEVHPNIQFGFAQFLIRANKTDLLQTILHYELLSDSPEVASLLCACPSPAVFQCGFDMLYRLQLYGELFPLLFDHQLYIEMLSLLASHTEVLLPPALIRSFLATVSEEHLRAELQIICFFRQPPPNP